jgi:biopolymer transport protein ExbB
MDFLAILAKGGLVMIPLFFCSVAVIAIAVERHTYYRQATTDRVKIASVKPQMLAGEWEQALANCEQIGGCSAVILAKGIEYRQRELPFIESIIEGQAALIAAKLRERLNYLDTIVTMAPLLGLLGTVIGMIQSFSVMNLREGQPLAITGGVGEALVATATGLCVALLALVVHSYFSQRLDRLVTDMEEAATLTVAAWAGRSTTSGTLPP